MAPSFESLFAGRPVILAPMEDVGDPVFRAVCRARGASLCVTEFVNVDALLGGCGRQRRKLALAPDDRPTAVQIYGSNPETLAEAAAIAEEAGPPFLDVNCGCWIPHIARRGAGAAWLREPEKMVAMAALVVRRTKLPVTVKTRIGWGPESDMPIVELAARLEGVGVRALTVHCRTAQARHDGPADWSWAAKAQAKVKIPVIVNGDVRTAADVKRALDETGCAGVMVGRGARDDPFLFREARALLDRGVVLPRPTVEERLALVREHFLASAAFRGDPRGVQHVRCHLAGYLAGVPGGEALRQRLNRCAGLAETLDALDAFEAREAA